MSNTLNKSFFFFCFKEEKKKRTDKLQECLIDVEKEMEKREMNLKEIIDGYDGNVEENKFMKNILRNDMIPDNLVVESSDVDEMLLSLKGKIDKMEGKIMDLKNKKKYLKSEGKISGKNYHVYGDLKISQMHVDSIDVEILNDRPIDFDKVLSLNKDQILEGNVYVDNLNVDNVQSPKLNEIPVEGNKK